MRPAVKADLTELVFEDRERRYGAYMLRKQYPRHLALSVLLTLLLAGAGMLAPLWRSLGAGGPQQQAPPPPAGGQAVCRTGLRVVAIPIPVPDTQPAASIPPADSLLHAAQTGTRTRPGRERSFSFDLDTVLLADPVPVAAPWEECVPCGEVREEPVALNRQEILSQMRGYPRLLADAGISGRAVFRILVSSDGRCLRCEVVRELHPLHTAWCVPHIARLRFTPAMDADGQPVACWTLLPMYICILR